MPEVPLMDELNIGDVITLDNVTGARRWRVAAFEGTRIMLTPLNADGSEDEFNALFGSYWLETNPL